MSEFHSTVSRRNFMKFMGMTAVGLGTVAAAAPVFHDLDELASTTQGTQKRPWYVKERDFNNPTVEVDWNLMKRRDPTFTGQTPEHFYGAAAVTAASAIGTPIKAQHATNNDPGFTYRCRAMRGSKTTSFPAYASKAWAGVTVDANWKGTAYTGVQTPTQRGEPKWTGSLEEGSKILWAFMRYVGAGVTGFGSLDQQTRTKVVSTCLKHTPTRPVVYEDVDQAYEVANGKQVIPSKPMSYISVFEVGNADLARAVPNTAQLGMSNNTDVCLKSSTWNFLQYLGYQSVGSWGDNSIPFVEGASASLTGLAELSRQDNYVLTPEYGCAGRVHNLLTDMPLEPTKPIDAGIFRFCHSCHKCANACPPGVISQEKQPSWDIYPATINGVANVTHTQGTKEFWTNLVDCTMYRNKTEGCLMCYGNCTFTVDQGAMVHELVKTTISTTPLLNGFFWHLGETFHYGADIQKAEDWWDLSLPVFGMDTTRVAFDGGYRK